MTPNISPHSPRTHCAPILGDTSAGTRPCAECGGRLHFRLMRQSAGAPLFEYSCTNCGQHYHLTDPATNEPETDEEKFEADVAPLIRRLSEVCGKHDFSMLVAVCLPTTPKQTPLMLTAQPNVMGLMPSVLIRAAEAMGVTAAMAAHAQASKDAQ